MLSSLKDFCLKIIAAISLENIVKAFCSIKYVKYINVHILTSCRRKINMFLCYIKVGITLFSVTSQSKLNMIQK